MPTIHGQKIIVKVGFNPTYYEHFDNYCKLKNLSHSEAVRRLFSKEYDSLPPFDKRAIQSKIDQKKERDNRQLSE